MTLLDNQRLLAWAMVCSFCGMLKCQSFNTTATTTSGLLTSTQAFRGCRNSSAGSTGILSSPNYPRSYSSNLDCQWDITVAEDKVILLLFKDIDIEEESECSYDKLAVQEKEDGAKFKTTGKFCGSKIPRPFQTNSNILKIIFTSDDSDNGRGFNLTWKAIPKRRDCGKEIFNSTTGHVTSPQFPHPYDNNLNCSYRIYAASGHQVSLRVTELDTEYDASCQYDVIEIYDVTKSGTTLKGRFCGTKPPKSELIFYGQQVLITFKSDGSTSGKGFNITWTSREVSNKRGNRTCGLKYHTSTRIVGGTLASVGEFPWQAGFFWRTGIAAGKFFCGGALIDSRWILTAAHCFVNGRTASLYKVRLGDKNIKLEDAFEQEMNISRIIIHPGYNMTSYDNDIALVQLDRQAVLDDFVNTLCLPKRVPPSGTRCVVAGWGATAEHGQASDVLMKAEVPIINADTCKHPDVYGSKITNNMICAGFSRGGIDTCQGDSGGPLHCRSEHNANIWEVQGIASWGRGCGRQLRYGVYTKMANYVDWVSCLLETNAQFAADSSSKQQGENYLSGITKKDYSSSRVIHNSNPKSFSQNTSFTEFYTSKPSSFVVDDLSVSAFKTSKATAVRLVATPSRKYYSTVGNSGSVYESYYQTSIGASSTHIYSNLESNHGISTFNTMQSLETTAIEPSYAVINSLMTKDVETESIDQTPRATKARSEEGENRPTSLLTDMGWLTASKLSGRVSMMASVWDVIPALSTSVVSKNQTVGQILSSPEYNGGAGFSTIDLGSETVGSSSANMTSLFWLSKSVNNDTLAPRPTQSEQGGILLTKLPRNTRSSGNSVSPSFFYITVLVLARPNIWNVQNW